MLTIFTIPKPFLGPIKIIQTNAIKSWMKLGSQVKIILIGSDYGVSSFAKKYNLEHIPQVETNKFGTPLVPSVFKAGEKNIEDNMLAYINCDIIIFNDFFDTAIKIQKLFNRFLIIGQRINLDVWDYVDFDSGKKVRQLIKEAKLNGQLHGPTGIDYFIYSRGLWEEIPKFALGRFVWDHWLVWKARKNKAAIVDASSVILAIHQNHNYTHVGGLQSGQFKIEFQLNEKIAGFDKRVIKDANFKITSNGVKRNINLTRMFQTRLKPYIESDLVQKVVKIKAKIFNKYRP